jgi:hypothetical protein
MPVFFNIKGVAFGILALVLMVAIVTASPDLSPTAQNLLFAGALFAMDMGYRFIWLRRPTSRPLPKTAAIHPGPAPEDSILRRDLSTWWLTTNRGGSIMLMPAWLFSAVFLLVIYVIF